MDRKICFVVMGFGKKKDPETNRTIDLDQTYQHIIRPAVTACDMECVRADEITETGLIDRSMYALLYRADIVIADVSTNNPNAIYELGVRHTLKKHSTIIIKEGKGNIPFDFNHNRVLNYEHLGNEISNDEAKRCKEELTKLITAITQKPKIDSPLYIYIPRAIQPVISEEDLAEIIGEHREKENSIYILTSKAKEYMSDNKFLEAAAIWKELSQKVENEKYYIQQQAFCIYKSKSPSILAALTDALTIIEPIKDACDTETTGILGAINKCLWIETRDASYLDRAIDSYSKGWNLYKDYYTGENYALCLLEMAKKETGEESIYYKIGAKKVFEEIVYLILKSLEQNDPEELLWKYATLSNAYLAYGDIENASKYEQKFLEQSPEESQIDTFNTTKSAINKDI